MPSTVYKRVACLAILVCSLSTPMLSQRSTQVDSSRGRPGLRVGLNVGINQVYADLSSPNLGFSTGINASYPLSSVVAVTLMGDLGSLGAQQADFYQSKSTASYAQGAVGGTINLSRLFGSTSDQDSIGRSMPANKLGDYQHRRTTPKGNFEFYIGMGLMAFNATASSLTTGRVQRFTNGAGSHRTQTDEVTAKGGGGVTNTREFVLPFGLRYNRQLSQKMSLYADLRYTFVDSDKLDATIENNNSTIDTPNGGDIFGEASIRTSRDRWVSLSIGLSYRFLRKGKSGTSPRPTSF